MRSLTAIAGVVTLSVGGLSVQASGRIGSDLAHAPSCRMTVNGNELSLITDCQQMLCETYENVREAISVTNSKVALYEDNESGVVLRGETLLSDLHSIAFSLEGLTKEDSQACQTGSQYTSTVDAIRETSAMIKYLLGIGKDPKVPVATLEALVMQLHEDHVFDSSQFEPTSLDKYTNLDR